MSRFRPYKAPSTDQSVFADPPLGDVEALLCANATLISHYPAWLTELRDVGRRELIESATRYTSTYTSVAWVGERDADRILVAGHQPELFHPGVWFKNFALSALAKRHHALAINLVVDNDVGAASSVRVPTLDRTTQRVRTVAIEYAHSGGGVPYEQTEIRDRDFFDSFGERLLSAVKPLVDDPVITRLWPHAKAAIRRCGFAGCALAQARHALECELGEQTLEIPVGVVSRGEAFARFIARLLSDAERFANVYNESLATYRTAHGIRSSAHPVPELAIESANDGTTWVEVPLWVYGDANPNRRQVWARRVDEQIEVSDRHDVCVRVDDGEISKIADQLRSRVGPDFKLRPRALLTTMFARLVLSDLFLHGIGGGKYDQLGDMITHEFFSLTPPEFMVLSATVQLPGTTQADLADPIGRVRRQLRDTIYQPERFSDSVGLPQSLIDEKRALLASMPAGGLDKAWHDQMARINAELSSRLAGIRQGLQQELEQTQLRQSDRHALQSRDHSFAIHPLESLVASYRRMLADI